LFSSHCKSIQYFHGIISSRVTHNGAKWDSQFIYNNDINQKQRNDNETIKKVMAAERVKDEFNEHSNKEEYAIFHSSGDTQYIDEEDFGEGGGGGGGGGEGGGASRIRTATKNVRRGGRT